MSKQPDEYTELDNAYWEGKVDGNRELLTERDTLRAELERVTGERDAKDHECHRLRDVLCDRNEDLTAAEARAVIAERERDAAEAERDKLAHWHQKYMELAAENTRLESRIEQLEESADPESDIRDYYALMMLCERQKLEDERDAARAAAATLRKWGATWREIAWDSERFQQFRTFDNIQQMWATVRPDVEHEDSQDD